MRIPSKVERDFNSCCDPNCSRPVDFYSEMYDIYYCWRHKNTLKIQHNAPYDYEKEEKYAGLNR